MTLPRLRVDPADVLVTGLKPAEDGKGWVVRLFGAGGVDRQAKLTWSDPHPGLLRLSNTNEDRGSRIINMIEVPAWGLVTVRTDKAESCTSMAPGMWVTP